ncbi:uncharacterized protein LOC131650233 [Vicia villosa]|uniref:uncharacterized protein LOC131650233 n=1 Tax=Vicia villosa TaxID=3911 RepID=UPI00273BC65C|nr:uncharacterized protein LOC131650233 [Vicia villosa]
MDLGKSGLRFTWKGPLYHVGQIIYEKLDRAMCNDIWRLEFPDAYMKVLARVEFSDHHPLMITLDPSTNRKEEKKFRFESAWIMNDTYQNDKRIYMNLKQVKEDIKEWKEDTMEQIIRRKRKIMTEMTDIVKKKEVIWYQCSRADWLINRDQNTKYYHMKVITRRRINKILMLQDLSGH